MEKIVKKAWGSEEWIVNRDYCGKFLNLNQGYRCSLHYHIEKDETFYVDKGIILLEIGRGMKREKRIMKEGDIQLVLPLIPHRFTGIQNSRIIEFSTHHEDSDSHRIEEGGKVDLSKLEK